MQLRSAAEELGVPHQMAYGLVHEGMPAAQNSGPVNNVHDSDVRALAARRAAGAPPPGIRIRDWAVESARLHATLVVGDETVVRQRLRRLASGVQLVDLCTKVIAPALNQIGADWASGQLTIGAEHRASMICEQLIMLAAPQPRGRPRGIAVVTTPPGERHGLPALMAAACLRQDQWLVHHLACDLPIPEVTAMARDTNADLVVLSTSTDAAAALAADAAGQITAAASSARVLVGQSGDSLHDLLRLARSSGADWAGARSQPRGRPSLLPTPRRQRGRHRHR
jgi:MerR family transcriptional regulator, light-induced transcriptional regulator